MAACLFCRSQFNIFRGGYLIENQTHAIAGVLERRGYYILDDRSNALYWAIDGWTNTLKKMNIQCEAAFFGDSITRGSDFQSYFPEVKIVNLGLSGDNLVGMRRRVSILQAVNPEKVFIMVGTNDLVHISLDCYSQRYEELLQTVIDLIPNATIYLQSVLPSNHVMGKYAPNAKVQRANDIIKELAQKYNCTYIDLYSLYVDENNEMPRELTRDGVHLYSESYDRWAEEVKKFL